MILVPRHIKRICAVASVVMAVALLLLVLGSWIITTMLPDLPLRSLLGGEGLRWFFESLSSNIANNGLVWLILLSMAWGSIKHSRILSVISKSAKLHSREKFAITLVGIEIILSVVVIVLLTAIPHAPLLSVTGELFPSSFSRGAVPFICMIVCLLSISYGTASGRLNTIVDILDNLTIGIVYALPFLVLYLFLVEFYCSLRFVLLL